MDEVSDKLDGITIRDASSQNRYWFIVAISKKKLHIYKFYPKHLSNSDDKLELFWEKGSISKCFVSNKGHQVCILKEGSDLLEITDIESGRVSRTIAVPAESPLKEVVFSPLDTHLMVLTTWTETYPNNLNVYNLLDDKIPPVISLPYQKTYTITRFPMWTPDEKYCVLRVHSDIKVWKNNEFNDSGFLGALNIQLGAGEAPTVLPTNVVLSISPVYKKGNCFIGIFVSNQGKFDQGVLKIYSSDDLQKPIFDRQFGQAEEGDLFWNKTGSAVIFRTFTNNVKGLSSYYGGNALFLIHTSNGHLKTISTPTEGLVHDISWSKKSNEFLIAKGPMPAELDSYDGNNGSKILSFGKCSRNTIKRDPFDRLALMGGFGNLRGDIDIWDLKTKKIIAQSKSDCSVTCEFSPDGRYFVTATTVPRMRVDCCFKIFSYSGRSVTRVDFEELHNVYVKSPNFVFAERDPSPHVRITESTSTSSAPLYRPPGALGANFRTLIKPTTPNLIAIPVSQLKKSKPAGPPGADAALLSAASKIGKKKKSKSKN
ncbi:Eukaryotic translation initiation factor eIF2A family member protein [Theileria equi strain WA]|uniref:Eukaryotic translation initiation factor 2A n=1 Tax=Theileria equi strain WA TaxID=1537102 RepID=L1LEF0_THEEQ|nr:Eukaryotic translation initiation factor eIF2A family member protein [Theileria equi strain WA]EKX73721.1 Eukaryotic translation initiation factor eIF2A family member protein [Theileria equi strain WA]|eukprot:XP_004833173.1 Eukaryotic translation initiation factor eIF2A family member protein [Theileria equi strain WA]